MSPRRPHPVCGSWGRLFDRSGIRYQRIGGRALERPRLSRLATHSKAGGNRNHSSSGLPSPSLGMTMLVLALGDLQIEGGALVVNHYRTRVEQLLAGAIVGGEAMHHAEGKEELDRFCLGSVA